MNNNEINIPNDLDGWDYIASDNIYRYNINDICWLDFYYNCDETFSIEVWSKYCDTPDFWIDNALDYDDAIKRVKKYFIKLEEFFNNEDEIL